MHLTLGIVSVLLFVSGYLQGAPTQGIKISREMLVFLDKARGLAVGNKDGLYYTPADYKSCKAEALKCFLLELDVVKTEYAQDEEEIDEEIDEAVAGLKDLGKKLQFQPSSETCSPCESYPMTNSEEFFDEFTKFIQIYSNIAQ